MSELNRFTSKALVAEMRSRNSTITGGEAETSIARVFDALSSLTSKDTAVKISGFGTFRNKFKAARIGRNPATGEAIQIAEKTELSFKPAKPA